MRFNNCGEKLWAKSITEVSKSIQLNELKLDGSENIILAGNYFIRNGERNAFVASLDENGDLNYFKVFDSGTADILYSMDVNSSNEIFLYFKTNIGQAGPNSQNTLAKLDANGDLIWIREYGFTGVWGQMCANSEGGALITDSRQMVEIDENGNVGWQKQFENPLYSEDHFEIPSGYVFFRYSISGGNFSYPSLVDKSGNLKWNGQSIPNFSPERGILRANGNLLFLGDFAYSAVQNTPALIEIDTANGEIIKTVAHINNIPLAYPADLTELSNGDILYSGSESLSFGGGIFLSRVNHTLARVGCKDSLFELNYPSYNGSLLSSSKWNSVLRNISILEPNLNLNDVALNSGMEFCDFSALELDLGKDSSICQGESIELRAPSFFKGYQWSSGENSSKITVDRAGEYALTAWTDCDTISDTIQISLRPSTKLIFDYSPKEPKVLDTVTFELKSPTKYQSIEWRFQDGTNYNTNPAIHQLKSSGSLFPELRLRDTLGCINDSSFQLEVEALSYRIPNVFTPNGDGINDEFKIFANGIESQQMKIFDRWGKLVFESNFTSWDGKSKNGEPLEEGTYYYTIRFKQIGRSEQIQKGSVNLLRKPKFQESR